MFSLYLCIVVKKAEPTIMDGCSVIFCFLSSLDDHITIGADCDELGAQIEEYILLRILRLSQGSIYCMCLCLFIAIMIFQADP